MVVGGGVDCVRIDGWEVVGGEVAGVGESARGAGSGNPASFRSLKLSKGN